MQMTSNSFILRPAGIAAAFTLIAAMAHPSAHADSTVYKCVDKNGRVEFTDINKSGCKALDLPGYIPAPPQAARPNPAPSPAVTMRQGAARPAGASPSNFPRVDTSTQRARDDDRREILNEELRAEEKKLADLKRDFNNGEPERQGNEKNYAKYQERVAGMRDDIGRAEKNVEAIKREIANTR
ncbi:DUF4124 domain-containing protein [Herbaspirillum sp. SJZ107]|uniref:DUF4124 domain-containing protein n=1 Tax=Herbaspirillum sp. SJZ107 TaxID=2572881 RepID=UPI0021074BB6|nr:DUF4124 domain-containing protein [Herbaspirillum sp. SJZ107]